MLTYEGRVIRQFSLAELLDIGAFLKSKDINAIYQELYLCMLPNKMHLLSMLMDDQDLIVSILERLTAKCQDADFDHEDEEILEDHFNEEYDSKFK